MGGGGAESYIAIDHSLDVWMNTLIMSNAKSPWLLDILCGKLYPIHIHVYYMREHKGPAENS